MSITSYEFNVEVAVTPVSQTLLDIVRRELPNEFELHADSDSSQYIRRGDLSFPPSLLLVLSEGIAPRTLANGLYKKIKKYNKIN